MNTKIELGICFSRSSGDWSLTLTRSNLHHFLAKEKFRRQRLMDSFPVELPHGEKIVETHRNLYWISGKLIQGGNLMKYLRRSMRGKGINFSLISEELHPWGHEGSWGKK
ncbi:hypothetical protein HS7_12840 [Sulfolobales archaeon HS-7]|nr:hypothetical protein HS7_12840 [Sulfolobales archaeon HS-7]